VLPTCWPPPCCWTGCRTCQPSDKQESRSNHGKTASGIPGRGPGHTSCTGGGGGLRRPGSADRTSHCRSLPHRDTQRRRWQRHPLARPAGPSVCRWQGCRHAHRNQ
jgi:hypothetical protein